MIYRLKIIFKLYGGQNFTITIIEKLMYTLSVKLSRHIRAKLKIHKPRQANTPIDSTISSRVARYIYCEFVKYFASWQCTLSSRTATQVVTLAFVTAGINVEGVTLFVYSLHLFRKELRTNIATKITNELKPQKPQVFHFDGKLLLNIDGSSRSDRLAAVVT